MKMARVFESPLIAVNTFIISIYEVLTFFNSAIRKRHTKQKIVVLISRWIDVRRASAEKLDCFCKTKQTYEEMTVFTHT